MQLKLFVCRVNSGKCVWVESKVGMFFFGKLVLKNCRFNKKTIKWEFLILLTEKELQVKQH